jgi:phosphoesterase RecJ-like protein
MSKAPEDLLQRVRAAGRVLITSHSNPDGDAIGSQLGLARVLRGLGKSATIWTADPVPAIYASLAGADRIHSGPTPPTGFPEAFDTLIVLECPSLDRTGLADELDGLSTVNIDHHLGNQHYGEVNWIDTAAPAVGEMVQHLAADLHLPLDADTATCLYLALVSDTGNFRFSNATSRAFSSAADLVSSGASPEQVSRWLYETRPEGMLRLLGEMLSSLELAGDGRLATALLAPEMFERAGAKPSDAEGLVDYPRSIEGVETVALLRCPEPGKVKVSLRSRSDGIDVERIARRHGGGGHRNAAGCLLQGELSAVREQIRAEIEAALSEEA